MAKFQTSLISDGNVFVCLYNPKAYDSQLPASWHDPFTARVRFAEQAGIRAMTKRRSSINSIATHDEALCQLLGSVRANPVSGSQVSSNLVTEISAMRSVSASDDLVWRRQQIDVAGY
ncbi:hypothetical protein [Cupriavidus sp. D39]|uniref:hypothetical protein n=1 Tax=Cupriavidus sp. D39 TaxID=2997877 RepID=UPI0022711090|nr:hypothetical protein [Cupriavidus sp. D39]MCY0854220.1 hypothetical protein [Cupriavidus sp. D39]